MYFARNLPTIYHFGGAPVEDESLLPSSPHTKWVSWGWSKLQEVHEISKLHCDLPTDWDQYELLKRFGFEAGFVRGRFAKGLLLLSIKGPHGTHADVEPSDIHLIHFQSNVAESLRSEGTNLYVPSGWAKAAIFCIATFQCVGIRAVEDKIVAFDEKGREFDWVFSNTF